MARRKRPAAIVTPAALRKRLSGILANQRRRAAKYRVALDYGVDDLLRLFHEATVCPYCKGTLTAKTIQFDHREAVSRGGSFSSENLQVVCGPCNRLKSRLHHGEMLLLLELLAQLPAFVRKDVEMRLKAGGAWAHSIWGRSGG